MTQIPVIDMQATGANINMLRMRAGITVRDLQREMGFGTPNAVYKWLRGDTMPTIDNLVILAAVFGVTIDEIIVLRTGREEGIA